MFAPKWSVPNIGRIVKPEPLKPTLAVGDALIYNSNPSFFCIVTSNKSATDPALNVAKVLVTAPKNFNVDRPLEGVV